MAKGRAKRLKARISIAAALFAMAVLAAVVPLHHAHMLSLALAQPTASSQQASPHREHGHGHHQHAHGDHHAGHAGHAMDSGDAGAAGEDHAMPRCPVCSLAQAAKAPAPSADQFIAAPVATHHEERPRSAAPVVRASFHFRPVQPRAPPTSS